MIISALKLILTIILILLAFVLLVLLCVLFVPFRYRINGRYDTDNYYANGELSFLLHALCLRICIKGKDDIHGYLRVFGIKVKDMEGRDKAAGSTSKKESVETIQSEPHEETSVTGINNTDSTAEHHSDVSHMDENDNCEANGIEDDGKETKEKNGLGKVLDTYRDFSTDKNTISLIKRELLRILKEITPKKGKINLHFGMDDPADTASVLQLLALVYPFTGDALDVTPDFSDQVLDIKADCSGRLRLIVPALSAIRLYKDNRIKQFIKDKKNKEG